MTIETTTQRMERSGGGTTAETGSLLWLPGVVLAWTVFTTAAVTGIVLSGALAAGGGAYFEGAMWGVRIPLAVLALPFGGFAALTVWWVAREVGGRSSPPTAAWGHIDRRALAIALLLLPAAAVLFALGEGFDGTTKLATALTVVQWILLTQALSRRPSASSRSARHVDTAATAGET